MIIEPNAVFYAKISHFPMTGPLYLLFTPHACTDDTRIKLFHNNNNNTIIFDHRSLIFIYYLYKTDYHHKHGAVRGVQNGTFSPP